MSNTIAPSLLYSNYQNEQKKTGSNTLGKDDFLKLLITQLQNQDPTNPMQDREFIAQMAQFSSLEQMTNMNTTLQKMASGQEESNLISYGQFIGKEITWHKLEENTNGEIKILEGTGKVVSLQFKEGNVYFILEDGTKLEPGNISQFNEQISKDNDLIQASMLIGKTVTYLSSSKEEVTGVIKSVSIKDGKVQYQLDDSSNTTITSSQMIKIQ